MACGKDIKSKDVLDCNSLPFFAGIQGVPQLDFAEVLMTIFLRTGWYHLMSKHDQTNYRCNVKWRFRLAQRNMVERWNSFEIRMIASSWYGDNTWLFNLPSKKTSRPSYQWGKNSSVWASGDEAGSRTGCDVPWAKVPGRGKRVISGWVSCGDGAGWRGWLVGWLVGCLLACLVACLLACLLAWLVGWLVGWLLLFGLPFFTMS